MLVRPGSGARRHDPYTSRRELWYSRHVLRRVVGVVVLAALGVAVGWPGLRSANAGPLAARRAVKLVDVNGKPVAGPWRAWANGSLVPTVKGRVTVSLAGCPSLPKVAGCVYTRTPRVIYMAKGLANARG